VKFLDKIRKVALSKNMRGFPLEDKEALESLGVDGIEVLDVRIKSPDNPVVLVDAKLLIFKI
jgi:hypothetical protein